MTKAREKRLVILDSHAIIHRAYHAVPDLVSSRGEPTGALYGLASMLLKTSEDLRPDYFLAARDLPGPTLRHEAFKEYKGTRAKADDALIEQLKEAPKVFEALGIPVLSAPGFEADDVIGTLVSRLSKEEGLEIIIASGDLDTLQLVEGEKVRVYTLRQGLSDTILYDEDRVRERYGFGPESLPDYKGLRGDPSDNIPGVKGIGEKTASELIAGWRTIEVIYDALRHDPASLEKEGVKPRVLKLLSEGESSARFSKQLAEIRKDAPVSTELPPPWRLLDHLEAFVRLCERYEFKTLKERALRLASSGKVESGAEDAPQKRGPVPEGGLKETSLALWLLHSDMTNPSLEDVLRYAKTDEFAKARDLIFDELRATGRLSLVFEHIEKPLIPVVDRMNETGIALDSARLAQLAEEYGAELEGIAARVYEAAGHEFNILSPKQLGAVLFDELGLTLPRMKKTPTGARTTREDELAKLAPAHAIVRDVLAYRELSKLLGTYIEKMPGMAGADGRLRATFLQSGTTTGRMSSEGPNLQNIPIRTEHGKRIREAFAAESGFTLVALDYSQIELRIAAGLSGDPHLVRVFQEGEDIHAAVASRVFGVPPKEVDREMRRRAKVINFGILYGMGVNALREALGEGVSRDEAARFLDEYFASYAGLARWVSRTRAAAAKAGYTETLFGRRRYFSGFQSKLPQVKSQAERMAVNAPIQGTQADIIKLAMVEADRFLERENLREKARLVLQIHDELVYEVAESDARRVGDEVRRVMESVVPESGLSGVPIVAEVSVGKNWGSLQKLESNNQRPITKGQ